MIYLIVEGETDAFILTVVLKEMSFGSYKIIKSNGFPSMPAVARTIMSYINTGDRVLIVCDQDSFNDAGYKKNMFAFLMRGAGNNPAFKLFTFVPNIDILIPELEENKGLKGDYPELEKKIIENMESILENETIQSIVAFVKDGTK